jgi:DNA-binding IclR family transcriptional regulator
MPAGALQRAVELLGRLGDRDEDLTVAELASDAGMPTSTAYRLLAELEQHGLVQRDADRTVVLGARLVALGRAAEAGLRERLVEPARQVMADLSAQVGETTLLTAPCGLEGIVLHAVETEQYSVRLSYAQFRRAPMHRGASGKILAAYLEPGERDRLIDAAGRPRLSEELDRIRAQGYVFTDGELDEGAAALAAPILDRRGRVAAGLSVAGPADRIAPQRDSLRKAVTATAQTIERAYQVTPSARPVGMTEFPGAIGRVPPRERHDSRILNEAREHSDRRFPHPPSRPPSPAGPDRRPAPDR